MPNWLRLRGMAAPILSHSVFGAFNPGPVISNVIRLRKRLHRSMPNRLHQALPVTATQLYMVAFYFTLKAKWSRMLRHFALLALTIILSTVTCTAQDQPLPLLNGIWRIDSLARQDAVLKSDNMTIYISANTISFRAPDEVDELQCTVDTSQTPWTIDIVVPLDVDDEDDPLFKWNSGSESDTQLVKGICKLEGNTLTLCLSDACFPEEFGAIICGPFEHPINDRPRRFDRKQGTLIVCCKIHTER